MRIGVMANIQFSMFSSGVANTSIAVYELLAALGHTVELVNMNTAAWWDDCKGLESAFKVVALPDASGYDLLFEIDRLILLEKERKRIAAKSVWILRHTFLVQEMELCLYPTVSTPKRELEGLHEVWMFDTLAAEEGALQAVELLARCPVRVIPYLWTPSIAATHLKEIESPSWIATTVTELRSLEGKGVLPKWKFHVTETNMSNTSSTVIPLVVLREAKRQGISLGEWKIHNSQALLQSQFFKQNILAHCSDLDVSGTCVGRQRCPEWTLQPMSCVLSHLRFTTLRPTLLDVVWCGVPLVHNSAILKDVGCGLERLFYPDNAIGEACQAIRRMEHDFVSMEGIFAPGALDAVRGKIGAQYTPSSSASRAVWSGLIGAKTLPLVMNPVPAPAAEPAAKGRVLRVGFADMWENFNPAYNFFTLMLGAAGAALDPPVEVVGGPATAADTVVFFGPFGESWKALPAEQPKIHFSGEFTAPIEGPGVKLNLGFHHFDMLADDYLRFPLWILEIDWFGAQADRIVNPKPIPLAACTQVRAAELGRKKKFCAFVVSNPSNPVRNTAFQWLSEYKDVDSAGAVMNTMGPNLFAGAGGGGGELKKFEFLKDYKFCLTYENTAGRGYTTEKFLHAKAAGCIPIYWGDPMVERDFCMGGAIDARKVKTKEELIELVRTVDENDSEWLKRYSVPALDDYRVAWCRRTMAECCRRIFKLGGFDTSGMPRMLVGRAPAAAPAPAPAPSGRASTIETPLMVTCVNRKFLPSLQQWLISVGAQAKGMSGLSARVYIFSDIPADTLASLKEKFKFASFVPLPDSAPPEGAFADFWKPQHYGWKLWIYSQLSKEAGLAGRMVLYMDAGAFLCRWPVAWLQKAQEKGICFLEDPREENRRWCSPEFCAALKVTEAELGAQQTLGGLVAFRCGATSAPLFDEALKLAYRREVLAGEKWAGTAADGRPYGHRHDQSILSILGRRAAVATEPLDTVYCDKSLRKTFNGGKCIYVHRGQFAVHVPFSEGIDDAYVINLDRRADRLEKLWASSPELQGRVERWPAVDGRALQMTPAIATFLKPNDFMWKKAISGCALSHLGLWWKLATETNEIESYLILEDDVKFKEGWEKMWRQAVAGDAVPEDCDIIYLGGVLPPNRDGWNEKCKERVNDFFCRVKENTMWGQDKPNRYFHFCAYSYILTKRGAQKVIDILRAGKGCWTSADHVLCNPVDVLKAYVMDPIMAGCYQDDDPKYATSQFNDFSRIDGFDSDLWNNDERFSEEERAMAVEGGELDIKAVLADAMGRPAAAAPAVPAAPLTAKKCGGKPVITLPRQFLCMDRHALKLEQLHEADWLMALFGSPTLFSIDTVSPSSAPPASPPVFILQKPHIEAATTLLARWSAAGAKFSILHMSDETLDDPLDSYELPGCEKVLRFYLRNDVPCPEKVTTIPLGYHWTLREGSKNPLSLTPKLPFRELVWSFHGTNWRGRKEAVKPLIDLSGAHLAVFYEEWLGAEALGKEQYISTLLNSVFVPCPEGVNGETFRFYEALECGCVPLIVRTDRNSAWVDWLQEHMQIVDLPSWQAAATFVEHLLANKEKLEKYRDVVLGSWVKWRQQLLGEGVDWLT